MYRTTAESLHVDAPKLLIGMQRAHPVVHLLAVLVQRRWVCKRRVQTVEMPVLSTVVTGDDCALAL